MNFDLRRRKAHDATDVLEALFEASDEFAHATEGCQGADDLIRPRHAAYDGYELALRGEAHVKVA
jgi:hypothetical protein